MSNDVQSQDQSKGSESRFEILLHTTPKIEVEAGKAKFFIPAGNGNFFTFSMSRQEVEQLVESIYAVEEIEVMEETGESVS